MKPSVAAVQHCERYRFSGNELQLCGRCSDTCCAHCYSSVVLDFGAVLSVSAHILTVALKKIEHRCSSLGMAQSVLINGPAVCGESALGAVEEWPQISKAKHLNTSEIPAKHRFNTAASLLGTKGHWELVESSFTSAVLLILRA